MRKYTHENMIIATLKKKKTTNESTAPVVLRGKRSALRNSPSASGPEKWVNKNLKRSKSNLNPLNSYIVIYCAAIEKESTPSAARIQQSWGVKD